MKRFPLILIMLGGARALGAAGVLPAPSDRPVDFARDIEPIFAAHCYACHGAEKQKSEFRLDVREAALTGGESGEKAIVPGKSAESPLVRFVAGLDPDMLMPPKKSDKARLSADQIGLLRAWIDAGAVWPKTTVAKKDPLDWWSLRPLRTSDQWAAMGDQKNPIDAFIRAKLAEKKLTPSVEADPRTLIRRITFDLIGLPPTPEEVETFVTEYRSPNTNHRSLVATLADRLLASPRHGERWARHWLDVAHFAETHGHDQDRIREHAWPYRDYVIAAFNSDKPYARFVQEQVAGDVLFPDDPQATVALGFLAAGPWDESSLRDIREDTIDRQIARYLDRDDVVSTVMQTFTSTTVQCARCHDHKFDPIPTRDYYALQAVFSGVDRANRSYGSDPATRQRRDLLQAQLRAVEAGDRALLLSSETQREVAERERTYQAGTGAWQVLAPAASVSSAGTTLTSQPDGSLLASGARPEEDVYTITGPVTLPAVTAVRLEVLPDDSLPARGPGRAVNGNLHLSELSVQILEPGATAPRSLSLKNPASDFDQSGWTIKHAADGDKKTAWGIFPQVGKAHEAIFQLTEKLAAPAGAKLTVVLQQVHGRQHTIGRFRLSVTDRPAVEVPVLPPALRAIIDKPSAQRSDEQRVQLAAFVLRERLSREIAALPPPQLVYAAASDFEPDGSHKPAGAPRPVNVLRRGDVRTPIELAEPGALSCVAGMPARFPLAAPNDEGSRRVALAKWLTDPRNALTWRSIVNRVWHFHFGRGLVDSPNDFGRMGGAPSHPELLDALAAWFRDEAHGSLKALHHLIVTSQTYRQASGPVNSIDPENRLLALFPRQRLDADAVRDAILAVSGQLDLRMGGPSDRHFEMKPGIHVTPRLDYAKFDVDAARRRSIYRFLFRTLPDPLMEALDCPAGDQLTPVRNTSVTIQQALALWNSAFTARMSEHFAARVEPSGASTAERVQTAVKVALSREATPDETRRLSAYADKHGMANLCRVLLNTDEFFFID